MLWFDIHGQASLAERYRPRLEAVRAELAQAGLPATNGFGQFALANSEHRVSRHRGGDLGWLPNSPSQDALRTEVMRLAGTLREPGEVTLTMRPDRWSRIKRPAALQDMASAVTFSAMVRVQQPWVESRNGSTIP